MDTDRELLEWAAKAAGYKVKWVDGATPFNYTGFLKEDPQLTHYNGFPVQLHWNPNTNDGDALRLAVKLGIGVLYSDFTGEAEARWNRGAKRLTEYGSDEPYAATRRAIVRAAAEIGKALK